MTTTNRFVGYLVSVECKNVFYQGIVTTIDSNKAAIQLKNCIQNGIHLGSKLADIKYDYYFFEISFFLYLDVLFNFY